VTFAAGMRVRRATSSADGRRPSSPVNARDTRDTTLTVSIMWTGMRMVRPRAAIPRVIAWRTHHVA
jgi:hypothetical protein